MKFLQTNNFKLTTQRKSDRGFTLIELLVVIAIIGMLSSVVLASMNSARVKARDARRLADAKQLQTAFEAYANDNSAYPASASGGENVSTLSELTPAYITALPKDPKNSGNNIYYYNTSSDRQSYSIRLRLEKNSGYCYVTEGSAISGWSTPKCY